MELVYDDDDVKSSSSLSCRQISKFFDLMKMTVWRIEVTRFNEEKKERIRDFCSGVCISSDGLILTHSFKKEGLCDIRLLGPDKVEYSDVQIVKHDAKSGLALLKPTQKKDYDHVRFVEETKFYIDKKLYAILYLKESTDPIILKGYVAYDCEFTHSVCPMRVTREHLDNDERAYPAKLGKRVPLVQIGQLGASDEFRRELKSYARRNSHGLAEGRGCPVFEATGNLVGVVAFQQSQYDFAIHIDEVKRFVNLGKEEKQKKRKYKSEGPSS